MSTRVTKRVHQFIRSKLNVHCQSKTPTQSIHQLTAYRRIVTIETRLKDYIIYDTYMLLHQPSSIKLIATKVELHEGDGLTKSTSSYDVTCL